MAFRYKEKHIDASISGSYRNEPLTTYIIGQFSYAHPSGKQLITNFHVFRRSFGTITIEEAGNVEEFLVECSGGKVFDRSS